MTNFWTELPKPFFILAPMEAVTDVVFRHVIAKAARPDVFFTEFTNTNSYCSPKGEHSTRGRLEFTADEQPIVAHIWGDKPEYFAQMARGMAERGFKGIDINMGCPAPNVAPKGCGSGLIRRPDVAAAIIAAAKEGGLPVSVKTRLGYSSLDEWRDWLTHLLRQDIADLTIHLRTKKEMSKVPAHYELIADIKKLRDEIAPQTLLTINGDIRDRQHGEELVAQYGVDGIMIGRGVFTNPFAFEREERRRGATTDEHLQPELDKAPGPLLEPGAKPLIRRSAESPATSAHHNRRDPVAPHFENGFAPSLTGAPAPGQSRAADVFANENPQSLSSTNSSNSVDHTKEELLDLLNLQLDLHDRYSTEFEPRRFEPLKRFFKIYIRTFDGASELRDQLMHTKSTDEVRTILRTVQ